MIKQPKKRGFTLIELLVVIAIIGILAGIVLVSVNGSRAKATDVHVIADVKGTRTDLEAGFSSAAYPDLEPVAGGTDPQTNAQAILNPSGPSNTDLQLLAADAAVEGRGLSYVVDTNPAGGVIAYAVYGGLTSTTTDFCMDSVGDTDQQAEASSTTVCP